MEQKCLPVPPQGIVTAVQTYIITDDEIRQDSVKEIRSTDDFDDPALGISNWSQKCETCGLDIQKCPGHTGHFELAMPIQRFFFVDKLDKILRTLCPNCSHIRLPKHSPYYKTIEQLPEMRRLRALCDRTKTVRVCGQCKNAKACSYCIANKEGCGHTIPKVKFGKKTLDATWTSRIQHNSKGSAEKVNFVFPVHNLSEDDFKQWQKDRNTNLNIPHISPVKLYNIVSAIPDDQVHMFGLKQHPRNLFTWVQVLPSLIARPDHTYAGKRVGRKTQDHHTKKAVLQVWNSHNHLTSLWNDSLPFPNMVMVRFRGKTSYSYDILFQHFADAIKMEIPIDPVMQAWIDVNFFSARVNSDKASQSFSPYLRELSKVKYNTSKKSVTEPFLPPAGRKYGALNQLCGVRIEKSGRGVLGASLEIPPGFVGIPQQVLLNITRAVRVNQYNAHKCLEYIRRGPHRYPGAKHITLKNGNVINLEQCGNRNLIDIHTVAIVHAHPLPNTPVLLSRNPVLHRIGISCMKIVPVQGSTIILPTNQLAGIGGDLDGDEVNLQFPQTQELLADAQTLMMPSQNFMRDGVVWMKFVHELLCSAYIMSNVKTKFTYEEANTLICSAFDLDADDFPHYLLDVHREIHSIDPKATTISGRDIIMTLLPRHFCINIKDLKINSNRQWIYGRLTNKTLNGTKGIIRMLHSLTNNVEMVMQFIYRGSLLFSKYLDMFSLSAGLFDVMYNPDVLPDPSVAEMHEEFNNAIANLERYIATEHKGHTPDGDPTVEDHIIRCIAEIDAMATQLTKVVFDKDDGRNALVTSVNAGAKGNWKNIQRMGISMGQTFTHFGRALQHTSHFHPLSSKNLLERYGFIKRGLSKGIRLNGNNSFKAATVNSVVRKIKGTASIGELAYALLYSVSGSYINRAGELVNSQGQVVDKVYGGDNLDSDNLFRHHIQSLTMTESDVCTKMGIVAKFPHLLQVSSKAFAKLYKHNVVQSLFDKHVTTSDNSIYALVDEKNQPDFAHKDYYAHDLEELIRLRYIVRSARVQRFHDVVHTPFDITHLINAVLAIKHDKPIELHLLVDWKIKLWTEWTQNRYTSEHAHALKLYFWEQFNIRRIQSLFPTLGQVHLDLLAELLTERLVTNTVAPGSSVAHRAVHNMEEPAYQGSLKAPHRIGKTKTVGGSVRLIDIQRGRFKHNIMRIVCEGNTSEWEAVRLGYKIIGLTLKHVLHNYEIKTDEDDITIKFNLNKQKCLLFTTSPIHIVRRFVSATKCTYPLWSFSKLQDDDWWIKLNFDATAFEKKLRNNESRTTFTQRADFVTRIAHTVAQNITENTIVQGIDGIQGFSHEFEILNTKDGIVKRWVIQTQGKSDIAALTHFPEIDIAKTTTSNTIDINVRLGKFAAMQSLILEYTKAMNSNITDPRHVKVLATFQFMHEHFQSMHANETGRATSMLTRANWRAWSEHMKNGCFLQERDENQSMVGVGFTGAPIRLGGYVDTDLFVTDEKHNKSLPRIKTQFSEYTASIKVDGCRATMVLFKQDGQKMICLIDRRNKIIQLDTGDLSHVNDTLFMGTVLDGELCKRKQQQHTDFCIFDCYMINGWPTSPCPIDLRLECARWACRILFHSKLSPKKTPVDFGMRFALPSTVPKFSTHIWSCDAIPIGFIVKPLYPGHNITIVQRHIAPRLPWHTDGLVLNHMLAEAKPFLTDPHAFLKWKPDEMSQNIQINGNTIDLECRFVTNYNWSKHPNPLIESFRNEHTPLWNNRKIGLYSSDNLLFTFLDPNAQHTLPKKAGTHEFGWSPLHRTWILTRPRNKRPNHSVVINRNLQIIANQITLPQLQQLFKAK